MKVFDGDVPVKPSLPKGKNKAKLNEYDPDVIIPADYWKQFDQLVRPAGCPYDPDSKLLDKVLFEISERDQYFTGLLLEAKRKAAEDDDSGVIYTKGSIQRLIYHIGVLEGCRAMGIDIDAALEKARAVFHAYYEKQSVAVDSYRAERLTRMK